MIAAMTLPAPRLILCVVAIALTAMLGVWIWSGSGASPVLPGAGSRAHSTDAGLVALPARGGEAPLISNDPEDPSNDAKVRNAADPFFAGRVQPAAPFRFNGSPTDLTRSRACLALAAMAEAGPSDPGQRAVIQVILNRVRHPAFAKTVCGVVFEGSRRASGCQFTFTCDGSLARRYGELSRSAALRRADEALQGAVFVPVGNATHYHTDWVYPAWSPQLVKLAQVETHLFYRWPGYWGSFAASRINYRGGEPDIAALEHDVSGIAEPSLVVLPPLPPGTPKVTGGEVAARDASGRANFMLLGGSNAEQAVSNARRLCDGTGTCRVMGWSDRVAIPAAFPLPSASRAALQFSYSRDPAGLEITLYNCDYFTGLPREKCIPHAR